MAQNTPKKKEPVLIGTAIAAVIASGGALAVLLGVDLSTEQLAGINAFAGAVIVLIGAITRSKVTPVDKVAPPITSERDL